jgi:hypothetical protein
MCAHVQIDKLDGPVDSPTVAKAIQRDTLVAKVTDFGLTKKLPAGKSHASNIKQGAHGSRCLLDQPSPRH